MSKVASIVDVLQGKIAIGEKVTVRGWVRTRRDSKAGLSFLAVYDGSCFDPIQAIVNNDIENYESEVLRLTTGCSVIVTGTIVESPAEGQAVELQAEKVEVTGFVEDPDTYPMAAKRHSIESVSYTHLTSVRERMLSKSPLRSKKSTFSALPVQDSDLAVPVITPARTNSWRMPNSAFASGTKRNPVSNKRTRFC